MEPETSGLENPVGVGSTPSLPDGESMERPDDDRPAGEGRSAEKAELTSGTRAELDLPVEPPTPWEQTAPPAVGMGTSDAVRTSAGAPASEGGEKAGDAAGPRSDASGVLRELVEFHLHGRLDGEPGPAETDPRPVPALLRSYLDLFHIRYDYPVCLCDGEADPAIRPLTGIIDELIEKTAAEGDEGRRLARHVYRLEAGIKSLAETSPGARLSELWSRAVKSLLATSKQTGEKKKRLRQDLKVARGALQTDGAVVPCCAEAVERIFEVLMAREWTKRVQAWRGELEALVLGLENILRADESRSPEALSPDRLRASAGSTGDELDFEAMSSMLAESDLGERIPESRRVRVQDALETLLRVKPLFEPARGSAVRDVPFPVNPVVNDCPGALERLETRVQVMVCFFRAVRIARLEIENRYRPDVHDRVFARYGRADLAEGEWALVPPVLLRLDGRFLAGEGDPLRALGEILNADLPLKVLVSLDDLLAGGARSAGGLGGADDVGVRAREGDAADKGGAAGGGPSPVPGWQARLGSLVMALDHVFVLQAPVSHLSLLQSGFADGFRYRGPALFCVYVGKPESRSGLSLFHAAAAATESRVFPALTYDPGRGVTWADRIDVHQNSQADRVWPRESFAYRKACGEETETELAFTAADFLFCDARLADWFWCVPPEKWHPAMVPLAELLRSEEDGSEPKIPYLATVDHDGRVGRALPTLDVVSAAARCASFWRNLQDLGGIDNSFARRALDREKERLEEEKRREVAEIERTYSAQLDRDLSGLTREIVGRIAGQLVAEGGAASLPASLPASVVPMPPGAPAAPPAGGVSGAHAQAAEAAPETAAVDEEDEEEAVVIDDPYIDTPLCTTCNECTNLNGQLFAYDDNKQAYIKDPLAGPFKDLVIAAEKCPVHIIHPGKPKNWVEPGLEDLIKRAAQFG